MRVCCAALALFFSTAVSDAQATGVAESENFLVMAADKVLADQVVARAEEYRQLIARQWLGEELPPGVGRTIVHVILSDVEDTGLAWPIDDPRLRFHRVWLRTTRENALGGRLAHEVAHTVLATRFSRDPLPAWVDEGIASLHDDPQRMTIRQGIIDWYTRTGNWPDLRTILGARSIRAKDQESYSAAASLTEYLLTRGGQARLLGFALAGKAVGWDRALKDHYGLRSVQELQQAWQTWAAGQTARGTRPVAPRPEPSSTNARGQHSRTEPAQTTAVRSTKHQ